MDTHECLTRKLPSAEDAAQQITEHLPEQGQVVAFLGLLDRAFEGTVWT
jgi:hypothetical protein